MKKYILKQYLRISIRITFIKYKNTLPKVSDMKNPKMDYHGLVDGVFWEDEGLSDVKFELSNPFRYVLNYRTFLITHQNPLTLNDSNLDEMSKSIYDLAKQYFPDWIGFQKSRNSFDLQLAQRIERIRKVSNWKMNKLFESDEPET